MNATTLIIAVAVLSYPAIAILLTARYFRYSKNHPFLQRLLGRSLVLAVFFGLVGLVIFPAPPAAALVVLIVLEGGKSLFSRSAPEYLYYPFLISWGFYIAVYLVAMGISSITAKSNQTNEKDA